MTYANVGLRIRDEGATAALRKVNALAGQTQSTFQKLKGAIVGVGFTLFARSAVKTAATLNDLKLRLRLLSGEYKEFGSAQKIAAEASQIFGLSNIEALDGLTNIYARLRPLGVELDDIKSTFIGFNSVAKMGGVSAIEAAGAFRQLSQALGSGRLQGDEFRSMAENVPMLMKAIGDEMDVPIGKLKELASEGKITSDIIIRALKKAADEAGDSIGKIVAESDVQKFKNFSNAMEKLRVAIGNKLLPVLTPFIKKLTQLVEAFTKLPEPVQTGIVGLVGLLASLAVLGPPLIQFLKTLGAVKLAFTAFALKGSTAAALLIVLKVAAIKVLAPILAIAGAVAGVVWIVKKWTGGHKDLIKELKKGSTYTNEASESVEKFNKEVKKILTPIEKAQKKIEEYHEEIEEIQKTMDMEKRPRWVEMYEKKVEKLKNKIKELNTAIEGTTEWRESQITPEQLDWKTPFREGGGKIYDNFDQMVGPEWDEWRRKQEQIKQNALAMKDVYADIGMTIKDGVVGAIQGAIDGTKTLGEAAVGVLKNIASKILDIGVNMMLFGAVTGTGSGSGLLGGFFGKTNKAQGGPVSAGQAYKVGERGPETFIPSTSGRISSAGETNIVVNVDASDVGSEGDDDSSQELGRMIGLAVQAEIVNQKRPGGLLAA